MSDTACVKRKGHGHVHTDKRIHVASWTKEERVFKRSTLTAPEVTLVRNYSGHLGNDPRPTVFALVLLCSTLQLLHFREIIAPTAGVYAGNMIRCAAFSKFLDVSEAQFPCLQDVSTAPIPNAFELKRSNMSKVANAVSSTWQECNQRKLKLPMYAS